MNDKILNTIICGENEDVLPTFEADSVDTVITDPPYGWSFMGKGWDYEVPSVETWEMILRVLKPGGTLLCFAGSRTQHRMACNVEDAGFILKDCIMWLYGSGFPKAKDISKAIDKQRVGDKFDEVRGYLRQIIKKSNLTQKQIKKHLGYPIDSGVIGHWIGSSQPGVPSGKDWRKMREILPIDKRYDSLIIEADREKVGQKESGCFAKEAKRHTIGASRSVEVDITASATPEAKLWDGWKSHGLKPAYEPILVAMKANEGSYANNALTHGVSGLNIDASRIDHDEPVRTANRTAKRHGTSLELNTGKSDKWQEGIIASPDLKGRYPANVILDEQAAAMLDEQSAGLQASKGQYERKHGASQFLGVMGDGRTDASNGINDSGGASRFFYCAKASKSERNDGCDELEEKKKVYNGQSQCSSRDMKDMEERWTTQPSRNHHPTVKPLALMEYLCRLTSTPTGGTVLDPFAGSGTTLLAAYNTGRDYIGIERDPDYIKIIEARLAGARAKLGLFEK